MNKLYDTLIIKPIAVISLFFFGMYGFGYLIYSKLRICRICHGSGYDLKNIPYDLFDIPTCLKCKGSGKRFI